MTIALGILANNGIVLAADTEQTWNYLKTSASKLSSVAQNGSIAITGSGTSGYLDGLSQKLSAIFVENPSLGVDELEQKFQGELLSFFDNYVIPCAGFATAPFCDLVIGVQRDGRHALWASTHASLRRCDTYAATGIGAAYAVELLAGVLDPKNIKSEKVDTAIAERVAVYVVWLVKQRVQGCGKETQVATAKDGRIDHCHPGQVSFLEFCFHQYSELQAFCFNYVSGYPFSDETLALKRFVTYLRRIQARTIGAGEAKFVQPPWGMQPFDSDEDLDE